MGYGFCKKLGCLIINLPLNLVLTAEKHIQAEEMGERGFIQGLQFVFLCVVGGGELKMEILLRHDSKGLESYLHVK